MADEDEDLCKISKALDDPWFQRSVDALLQTLTTGTPQDICRAVRDLLLTTVVNIADAWDTLVHTLNVQEDDNLRQGLQLVVDVWSLAWLFEDCWDEVTWPIAAYTNTNQEEAKAALVHRGPLRRERHSYPKVNLRLITKELFVIHFCSGIRREGDIQWWTERIECPHGHYLTTVSVDIIFHGTKGDLSSPACQTRWLNFLKTACVCAIFLGPPCSTWSISRWRYYSAIEDCGPRPTRSVGQPFGSDALTIRELLDICLGNTLLLFSFSAMLIQAWHGRVGVLEHPAPRDLEKYPSIWGLGAFRHLLRVGTVKAFDIYQGYFGALSPKPTRLAVCGQPKAEILLASCHTTNVLPPPLKMGKEEGRGYSTSQLKEYPSAMARGLAMLAHQWILDHCSKETCVEPAAEFDRELVEPFCIDMVGLFTRGADTRGQNP